jgi:hypothetical protein
VEVIVNFSIKTQDLMNQTEGYREIHSSEPDDPLRLEIGWGEVAGGLGKILLGYLLIIMGVMVLIVVALVAADQSSVPKTKGSNSEILVMWVVMLGLGLVGLLWLICWLMILGGQVRCAVHCSDRHGARWIMFACLLCLAIGPVLNMAISFAYQPTETEMKQIQETMMRKDSNPMTLLVTTPVGWLNILLSCVSLGGQVFFILFLRATGACFRDNLLKDMADYYLMLGLVVLVASGYAVYQILQNEIFTPLLLGVGFGWLVLGFWYLVLIYYTRTRILTFYASLKSPLETG